VGKSARFQILLGGAALGALLTSPALAQVGQAGAEVASEDIIVTAQRREQRGQDVPVVVTAFSADRLEKLNVTEPQDLYGNVPSLTAGNQATAAREAQSYSIRGQATSFLASPAVVQYLNEVPLPYAISLPLQGGVGLFVDMENVQVLSGPQGTLFGRNTTGGAVLFQARRPSDRLEGYIEGSVGNYNLRAVQGAFNLPLVEGKLLVRVVGAYRDRRGFTKDLVWNKWRDDDHWYSGRIGVTFRPTERLESYLMLYGSKSSNNGAGHIHSAFNLASLAARGQCTNGTPTATIASCAVYARQTEIAHQIGPRRTRLSVDAYSKISSWGAINNTSYELSDGLTLRNIVSYQKLKDSYGADSDGTPLQTYQNTQNGAFPDFPIGGFADEFGLPATPGNAYLNRPPEFDEPRDHVKQFTEELQLQGSLLENRLIFTAGGFYFDSKPAGPWRTRTVQNCAAAFTGQVAGGCIASDGLSGVSNRSTALYGQGTLDFGAFTPSLENLRFTAGYRYTWDRIKGFSSSWAIGDAPTAVSATNPISDPDTDLDDIQCLFGTPALQRFLNTTDGSQVCNFGATLKSSAGTWTIGLDYKPIRDLMIYGKISRGYKSGGFNSFAIRPTTTTFQPEELTTYEAGFKSDWRLASMPVRFNLTYYYSDYKNIHRPAGDVELPRAGAAVFSASATIQGFEAEVSVRPSDAIEIGGTVSHADGDYKTFDVPAPLGGLDCGGPVAPGGTLDLSCSRFQYLTPWIYNIYTSIDLPVPDRMGDLSLFVSYSHVSAQWTAPRPTEPGALLEPYGLLNASLSWNNVAQSGFDLSVFANNLTNKLFRVGNNNVFSGSLVQSTLYGEPRMYGFKLRYRWGK